MSKSIVAAAVAVFVTLSPVQADQATGTIMAIDVVLHQFMLSDGAIYVLPKSVPASNLTIGAKVKVTYTSLNGINTATAVARVK